MSSIFRILRRSVAHSTGFWCASHSLSHQRSLSLPTNSSSRRCWSNSHSVTINVADCEHVSSAIAYSTRPSSTEKRYRFIVPMTVIFARIEILNYRIHDYLYQNWTITRQRWNRRLEINVHRRRSTYTPTIFSSKGLEGSEASTAQWEKKWT